MDSPTLVMLHGFGFENVLGTPLCDCSDPCDSGSNLAAIRGVAVAHPCAKNPICAVRNKSRKEKKRASCLFHLLFVFIHEIG